MERVLIVDDEPMIVDLLAKRVGEAGFLAEGAGTAAEAVGRMRLHRHPIVLCDIRLPDMDGTDLVGRLKDENPLAQIVMITGYSSMDYVVECFRNGAVDYFTKPFRDLDAIVRCLKQCEERVSRWRAALPVAR